MLNPTRRALIQFGCFGWALPGLAARRARARNCILVWLDGGPSHLDLFDLKPDAPREVRGEFKPAATPLDGLLICEHLPRIAKRAGRLAFVRSLTSVEGNHDRASCHYLTGYHPSPAVTYPSVGAVVNCKFGPAKDLPLYIAVPAPPQYGGAGYLGAAWGPFSGFRGEAADGPGSRRLKMLRTLDELCRDIERNEASGARDALYEQAYRLMASPDAKRAFETDLEPEAVRSRYGGHALGRGLLTARRLIEAGARLVTVKDDGWDTHQDNFTRLTQGWPGKLPGLDQAYAALIEDLESRGLLDETLVVLMGEFGRTPRINASAGRDHWPRANTVVLAGGGIRRGVVFGKTDAYGELPDEHGVEPEDLLATVYHLLGIDPDEEFKAPGGRPLKILSRGTKIEGILA
jgi:hypothetical protein